jgi:hypothetical protein
VDPVGTVATAGSVCHATLVMGDQTGRHFDMPAAACATPEFPRRCLDSSNGLVTELLRIQKVIDNDIMISGPHTRRELI